MVSVFLLFLAQEKPRRLPYRETPSGCLKLYSTMRDHDVNKAHQRLQNMIIQRCKHLIHAQTCTITWAILEQRPPYACTHLQYSSQK